MKLLAYLQSKSREVKAQYAALIAGVATGAIAVVWASTIPSRFADAPLTVTDEGDSLSELVNDTKTQLGNVIGAEESPAAEIGKNLNLLEVQNENAREETSDIGGLFPLAEDSVGTDSTTTGEKRILIEPVKTSPKTILIGTTTSGN